MALDGIHILQPIAGTGVSHGLRAAGFIRDTFAEPSGTTRSRAAA